MDFKFRIYLFNNNVLKVLSGLAGVITLTFWRPEWDYIHFVRYARKDMQRRISDGR